jgi:hypothetical protein
MKNFLLTLSFLVILFFLPLGHDLSRYGISSRLTWNDLGWFLGIFLIGIFLVQKNLFNKKSERRYFSVVSFLSLFLLAESVYQRVLFTGFVSWVRYLIFLWLPLGFSFIRKKTLGVLWLYLLIGVICLQAQWGIVQFVIQHDLGFQILGESDISSAIPGVAKFMTLDHKIVRAYGPYGHPNAFAATLLVGIYLIGYLFLKFYSDEIKVFPFIYILPVGYILFLALLLSFSRVAYLSAFLLACCLRVAVFSPKLPFYLRSSVRNFVVLGVVTLLVLTPLFIYRFTDREDMGFVERGRGSVFAFDILRHSSLPELWFGHGVGLYRDVLQRYFSSQSIPYEKWEVAPLHNTLGLLVFEIGIMGMLFVGIFIFFPILRHRSGWLFLLPLLPLALGDHYFLTQTTPAVFWILAYLVTTDGKQRS